MFCDRCGEAVGAAATVCPHCGHALDPVLSIPTPRRPLETVRPGTRAAGPRPAAWFAAVWRRNLGGTVAGALAAWFNIPFVLLMGALGVILGAVAGTVSGTFAGAGVLARVNALIKWVFPLPVTAQQLLPTSAAQIGGILGGILGAVHGGLLLAWDALVWPWQLLDAGDPTWPWAVAIGQLVTAMFSGGLYVLYATVTERLRLHITGARRPSSREEKWLAPLMAEVCEQLGITRPPRVLIDDRREVNAYTGIRHIVLYRGLLDEIDYDGAIAKGVLAHELAHWRAGDPIALAWNKGVCLPLYILYALGTALLRRAATRPLQFVLRVLLWSVLATVDYIVMPAQSRVWRQAEYDADAVAMAAGYGDGLRAMLVRLRGSWETGRDGWDDAVCATHPPTELRLERLEVPGRSYSVGVDDSGAGLGAVLSAVAPSTVRRD